MITCYVLVAAVIILTTHVMMTQSTLKVHILTYNTGSTGPSGDKLEPLLGLQYDPDIISAGFEELLDADDWENDIDKLLSERGYYRIKLVTMSLIQIVIFAKKAHLPYISHIETEYTKTGFVGMYGNKGGTSVRFRLYDKTVAILNTHLSAHIDQVEIRDEEYWNIMSEQDFDDPLAEHLYDHDYLFWSGDLNYRIDLGNPEVRGAIASGKYLHLLDYDQLRQEKQAGHAFIGFHEADITFPPTYKFDPETDVYDSSGKNRIPAWCDRVLWRIKAEREEIVHALNWGGTEEDSSDITSLSSCGSELSSVDGEVDGDCEVDGAHVFKKREQNLSVPKKGKKKKKKKKKEKRKGDGSEDDDLSDRSTWEVMRRRTASLMKKTAVYATTTGSAILRSATGSAPIKIHKADVADPERFKNLMNTLEREKVSIVKEKYENCVRPVVYKSYPEYKQSDHKPVAALLEVGVNTSVEPLVRFGQEKYTWKKGEKLKVTIITRAGVSLSSWDWVALVETNWTDTNKHYITYEYVPSGKDNVKFPWEAHPGASKTLHLVFNSSKMRASIAIAEIDCVS